MNNTELYRIIEQKERHINSLETQNKNLIVEKMNLQEQLDLHVVSCSCADKEKQAYEKGWNDYIIGSSR